MQINVKTIIVVVLLSALVWIFAERAVVKTAIVDVEISLFSNNAEFMVQYLDGQGEPTAEISRRVQVNVKGPASLIQALQEGKLTPRIVRSDIEAEKFTNLAGQDYRDFTPRVLDLLDGKVTFEDQDGYLVAEEVNPAVLPIRVTKLLPVSLRVQVVGENDIPLPQERIESIEPAQIQAYVAGGATNDAVAILNISQQQKATQQPVTVSARIPGLARPKDVEVKIKLLVETTIWPINQIDRLQVGICKPYSMEGEYRVIIEDLFKEVYRIIAESDDVKVKEKALEIFDSGLKHLGEPDYQKIVERSINAFKTENTHDLKTSPVRQKRIDQFVNTISSITSK